MAYQYNIIIHIKYNEHDNENNVLASLLRHLSNFKSDIDGDMVHEDIFYNLMLFDGLEFRGSSHTKMLIKNLFTNFAMWNDIQPDLTHSVKKDNRQVNINKHNEIDLGEKEDHE